MIVVLPAPVAPTIATCSPGATRNETSSQHPVLALVREAHVVELDRARAPRRPRAARTTFAGSAIGHRRLGVEQLEDALGARHRGLHHRVLRREVAQRQEEAPHPVDEHVERAHVGQPGRLPDDDRDRDPGGELDHREQRRVVADRHEPGVAVIGVHRVELAEAALLAREELHHLHAGDVLLEIGVDARDPHAHGAERLAHLAAEDDRRDREQRHHQERERRRAARRPGRAPPRSRSS